LLNNITEVDMNDTNPLISGLIFGCDDYITSSNTFYYPSIIALTSLKNATDMYNYTYSLNPNVLAYLNHTFIERCGEIDNVALIFYIMTGVWLIISAFWIYLVYFRFKQHALYMQKTLTLFPICKVLDSMINGFYLDNCPWVSTTASSDKYVEMARISIVTISYTIFLAVLYLMSKGWNTLQFSMNRNQATYLTMIMGGVYLTYSAYFLSTDFTGVKTFMLVSIHSNDCILVGSDDTVVFVDGVCQLQEHLAVHQDNQGTHSSQPAGSCSGSRCCNHAAPTQT
jgi:hypothetical protein